MTGYRESEMITMCDNVYPTLLVPFTMYECTGYYDKNRPSWKDMQRFALDIDLGNPKPAGFKTGVGIRETAAKLVRPKQDEDDDD
jgi:hypothetical protein